MMEKMIVDVPSLTEKEIGARAIAAGSDLATLEIILVHNDR
jgi:hypothetical protein